MKTSNKHETTKATHLARLANQHSLKLLIDSDGTEILPGRKGHIYEFAQDRLAVMFIPPQVSTRKWRALRTEALAAGMMLEQNGESEGSLSFDPNDSKQVQIALKITRPKRQMQLSAQERDRRSSWAARLTQIRRQTNIKNDGSML